MNLFCKVEIKNPHNKPIKTATKTITKRGKSTPFENGQKPIFTVPLLLNEKTTINTANGIVKSRDAIFFNIKATCNLLKKFEII